MKKTAYFIACAAILLTAPRLTASVKFENKDLSFELISPDGRYAIGDLDMGSIRVMDTYTCQEVCGFGSYDEPFFRGYGNAISHDNLFVGEYLYQPVISDLSTGTWTHLPLKDKDSDFGQANGISGNGNTICGVIYRNEENKPREIPVIWTRDDSGEFCEYMELPYPETDWTGQVPYIIRVFCINDTENLVLGVVYNHFQGGIDSIAWPIIFTKDNEGNWTYQMAFEELLNPDNIKIPSLPEEKPGYPDASDYLTAEEKEAYDQAFQEWMDDLRPDCPDPKDFLNPESLAKYSEDLNKYEEWKTRFNEWADACRLVISTSPHFDFTPAMSPSGRYFSLFEGQVDFYSGAAFGQTFIFDLKEKTYETYEETDDAGVIVKQLWDNGTALGYKRIFAGTFIARILDEGAENFITLYDWMKKTDADVAGWMEENMSYGVPMWDKKANDIILYETVADGMPCASHDMKIFATRIMSTWHFEDMDFYPVSYLLDCRKTNAAEILHDNGLFDIFTIDGAVVMTKADKTCLSSLPAGVYLLRSGSGTVKYMTR